MRIEQDLTITLRLTPKEYDVICQCLEFALDSELETIRSRMRTTVNCFTYVTPVAYYTESHE